MRKALGNMMWLLVRFILSIKIYINMFRRASEPGIEMVNGVHEKAESEEKLSAANQAKLLKAYQQVRLFI